jgi:hypothetical protein
MSTNGSFSMQVRFNNKYRYCFKDVTNVIGQCAGLVIVLDTATAGYWALDDHIWIWKPSRLSYACSLPLRLEDKPAARLHGV